MSYIDTPFPECIAFGAMGHVEWAVEIATNQGGYEQRTGRWLQALQSWDIGFAVRTASDYQAIKTHWHQMRGSLHTFPFQDPLDHGATSSEGQLQPTDTPGEFQMTKAYSGANPYSRRITRPLNPVIYIDGVPATEGGAPGNYSLEGGTVTFVGNGVDSNGDPIYPAPGDLSWSGEFVVPCRYDVARLPVAIVNRVGGSGELLVQCDQLIVKEVRE